MDVQFNSRLFFYSYLLEDLLLVKGNTMFEFTFYVGATLIIAMVTIHHYYSDKIRSRIEKAEDEWCRELAKAVTIEIRSLIERYNQTNEIFFNAVENFYYETYKTQLKTARNLIIAEEPRHWLDSSLTFFFFATVFFFVSGYLSYTEFSIYSLPMAVAGGLFIVAALYQMFRIMRSLMR